MLCDICGKNVATVHLTEIVDDQMTELHLCEDCARQKSLEMEQQFGLADLLAGLAEFGKGTVEEKEIIKTKCPNCNLTYEDFRKIGRLGCSECYTAFKKYLAPLLKKIHGSTQHFGKLPMKTSKVSKTKLELQDLCSQLQRAIQIEAFEEAAKLRDKIRELEKKDQEQESKGKEK